jgi:hypothetical protein
LQIQCSVRDCKYQQNNLCELENIKIAEFMFYPCCDNYKFDITKAKQCSTCKHEASDDIGIQHISYFICKKSGGNTNFKKFNNCWESK